MAKWIQKAIKHPGALTAKAKAAGMTVQQYCQMEHKDTQTKRQCALASTLRKLARQKD